MQVVLTSLLIIGIPFLLSALWFALGSRLNPRALGVVSAGALAALFAFALSALPGITAEGAGVQAGAQTGSVAWVAELGLKLSFYVDGLSWLFVLLITGISAMIMLYAGGYFDDAQKAARFLGLLLLFTGSMLALVLAGNVLTLFIAWEMTSIVSFLLIGFDGDNPKARSGALQALIVTAGGGLALLVGLLVLSAAGGSTEFAALLNNGDLLREHPWYAGFTALILIGCFSKSAQTPLHFWLPDAMTAPTPASAFLHSATMVKAGIYLLARLSPALGDTPLWETALIGFGLLTFAVGAVFALRQRDLKAMLAYATISQLGGFVALIGLPHGEGLRAAAVGILAHALYKAALFMVVGAVDHATGSRLLDQIGGLRRRLPGLAAVAAVAALSMAGVPPLLGFVSKENLLEAMAHENNLWLLIALAGSVFSVVVAIRLFWDVFMGRERLPDPDHFHPPSPLLTIAPGVLVAVSVVFGLGVAALDPLVSAVVGESVHLHLFPPYGINLIFVLSLGVLLLGFVVFAGRQDWLRWSVPALPRGSQVYNGVVRAVERAGDRLLTTQNGKLRYYLFIILLSVIALVSTTGALSLSRIGSLPVEIRSAADLLKGVLILLALGATLASILFRKHLLAALALGIAGYSIGGLFLLEPAPDVALVQFLVETLATILIILILTKVSEAERKQVIATLWQGRRGTLWRDIALSAVIGVGVTIFALEAVASRPTPAPIAQWHLENALPQVKINDVVASIVTDFRGMDTLIEITVFGMAGIGVLTLLATPDFIRVQRREGYGGDRPDRPIVGLFRRRAKVSLTEYPQEEGRLLEQPPSAVPPDPQDYPFSNPLTHMAARVVLPIALLIAAVHLFYGGVGPGDGFTAGVVAGLGVALRYIVFGYHRTRERLTWLQPVRFVALGLTLAFANAALPMLFGRDFMAFTYLDVDFPGDIHLSSTFLFEVSIFLTVFGGSTAIMEAITHPREVEPL